jgi:hypothetical protein
LAREVKHDTANSPRHSRRLIRVWVGAHHGGGGIGTRQRGDLSRAEEKGAGKRAGVLLTIPGSCDGGLKSRIVGAEVESRRHRGGSTAAQPSAQAMAQRRKGSGKAGDAEAA